MDLSKSREFFNPADVKERIHIVGCGSVGSTVAENLARIGLEKFTLWDFDKVEQHNIANQMFTNEHVGRSKAECLQEILQKINPDIAKCTKIETKGWNGQTMSGYIFLCVDNIEVRKKIVEQHKNNFTVKGVFDFRTMLTEAEHYAADWNDLSMKENLLNSMDFKHEEAEKTAPVSACGTTLGVVTTVRLVSALGVNNFISFVKGEGIKKLILVNGFKPDVLAF